MGRGGGGGGGRSGGGGGHRSGGGRSSSHRGASSSSYRSRGSHTHHYHSHSYYGGGGYYYGTRGYSSGRPSVLLVFLSVLIMAVLVIAVTRVGSGITKSTVQREKLPATAYTLINDWFEDDWNWVGTGRQLEKGLRKFQSETGVQVYVAITDTMRGYSSMEQLANGIYDEVFGNDEGHAVFVWYERDDGYGNGDGRYSTYLCVGAAAGAVLDSEAVDIVLDYFDQHYADTSLSEDELLSLTFSKSATRMMKVTKSPVGTIITLGIIFAIIVAVFNVLRIKYKRDKEKAEETQQILNTPLEHLTADDPDLKDKYGG